MLGIEGKRTPQEKFWRNRIVRDVQFLDDHPNLLYALVASVGNHVLHAVVIAVSVLAGRAVVGDDGAVEWTSVCVLLPGDSGKVWDQLVQNVRLAESS